MQVAAGADGDVVPAAVGDVGDLLELQEAVDVGQAALDAGVLPWQWWIAGPRARAEAMGSAPIQIRWLGSRFMPILSLTALRRRNRVSGFQTSIAEKFSSAYFSTPTSSASLTIFSQNGKAQSSHW